MKAYAKMSRVVTRVVLFLGAVAFGILGLIQLFRPILPNVQGVELLLVAAIGFGSSGIIDKLEQVRRVTQSRVVHQFEIRPK